MLLVEREIQQGQIIESSREKLPDGVLCRVLYPICNIGQLNANKRIYETAVWEKVLSDPDIKTKIENRALFGHAEHPSSSQSDLQLTSHVICEMKIEGNKVYQVFDVLDTPTGRIVDCLLRAGCKVGVSTRAEGELEEKTNGKEKYYRVIPESFKYITTDFTADPSTFGVAPLDIRRTVRKAAESILSDSQASEADKKLGQLILEATQQVEGSESDRIPTLLEIHRLELNRQAQNALIEGLKKELEEKNDYISHLQRRIKFLQTESSFLREKTTHLDNQIRLEKIEADTLQEGLKEAKEEIEELKKINNQLGQENSTLTDENRKLSEELIKVKSEIEELTEKVKKTTKKLQEKEEELKTLPVKIYVEYKLKSADPQLRAALALLEKCQTIEEVDKVYSQVIRSIRENALHSSLPKDLVVTEDRPKDEKVNEVYQIVKMVLGG